MKILCINLDSRPDRWELAQQEFDRAGLQVERFPGVVNDNPVLGFNKAVYGAMEQAIKMVHPFQDKNQKLVPSYEDLLLFEDDVILTDRLPTLFGNHVWMYHYLDLPGDYLTLHLGANLIGTDSMEWQMPTKHSDRIAKIHNAWQSHATLYSAECVKYIIENFPYWKDEYQKEGCQIFDEWLRLNVLPMGRSYVLKPMIAYQRPDFSNIWNSAQDYTSCHTRGNQYLNSL